MKVLFLFALSNLAFGEEPCDFSCTEQWEPVCGSDGVTYANNCYLELANCKSEAEITQEHKGECETTSRMTRPLCHESMMNEDCDLHNYAPLCESSGTTYKTLCHLCQAMFEDQRKRNIMYIISHLGPC